MASDGSRSFGFRVGRSGLGFIFVSPAVPPHLAGPRCTSQFSSPPPPPPFLFLWLLFPPMSHQSSPLSEEDGLNHNTANGFVKTNGNGSHYKGEDTPMSEDDDVPLVRDPIFF